MFPECAAPPRPKTRGVLLGWHPVAEYQGHRESNITCVSWDPKNSAILVVAENSSQPFKFSLRFELAEGANLRAAITHKLDELYGTLNRC